MATMCTCIWHDLNSPDVVDPTCEAMHPDVRRPTEVRRCERGHRHDAHYWWGDVGYVCEGWT